jgi:phospholipid/cholesterol/gamma-HCH transport system substrate-binding protein
MRRPGLRRRVGAALLTAILVIGVSGCGALKDFRGANSLPLVGTKGTGAGSYIVQAQMKDVQNLKLNSRVRVNDITVGTVTDIERQGWHALVTMSLDGAVHLPANATATLGQTSLLGSLHIELAPPTDAAPSGDLRNGAVIPISATSEFPSTEETLGAASSLLNGGSLGKLEDVTTALNTAFSGREADVRSLIDQLDLFVGYLDDQKGDIIAATESLNNLAGQFAAQKPVVDKALKTLPQALEVLSDDRDKIADAITQFGQFSALAADSIEKTKVNLVKELGDVGPVLQSLADAGPALTRSLDLFTTFPFYKPTLNKWLRGDFANLSAAFDLTQSRIDASMLTGTFLEGELTELEMQYGRTTGVMPSPYTARNPLVVPYHFNQGP